MRTRTLSTLGGLSVSAIAAATFVLPGTAGAAAPEQEQPDPARVERLCLRVDNLTLRTTNVLDRIQGDAETRGSLLWLDRRIENALENDRAELADVLQNRRNVREAAIPVLEQRLGLLADVDAKCTDAGY